tara:strand:+ start:4740 stop:8168 length:3429 start_codon:yes stop_codon:yes gene_type:complete
MKVNTQFDTIDLSKIKSKSKYVVWATKSKDYASNPNLEILEGISNKNITISRNDYNSPENFIAPIAYNNSFLDSCPYVSKIKPDILSYTAWTDIRTWTFSTTVFNPCLSLYGFRGSIVVDVPCTLLCTSKVADYSLTVTQHPTDNNKSIITGTDFGAVGVVYFKGRHSNISIAPGDPRPDSINSLGTAYLWGRIKKMVPQLPLPYRHIKTFLNEGGVVDNESLVRHSPLPDEINLKYIRDFVWGRTEANSHQAICLNDYGSSDFCLFNSESNTMAPGPTTGLDGDINFSKLLGIKGTGERQGTNFVVAVPYNGNTIGLVYSLLNSSDPLNYVYDNVISFNFGRRAFVDGVQFPVSERYVPRLDSDGNAFQDPVGKVLFIPENSEYFYVYNIAEASNDPSVSRRVPINFISRSCRTKGVKYRPFCGGVALPYGTSDTVASWHNKIYCIPYNNKFIGYYDTTTEKIVYTVPHDEGDAAFIKGISLENVDGLANNIALIPKKGENLILYDTVTDTIAKKIKINIPLGSIVDAERIPNTSLIYMMCNNGMYIAWDVSQNTVTKLGYLNGFHKKDSLKIKHDLNAKGLYVLPYDSNKGYKIATSATSDIVDDTPTPPPTTGGDGTGTDDGTTNENVVDPVGAFDWTSLGLNSSINIESIGRGHDMAITYKALSDNTANAELEQAELIGYTLVAGNNSNAAVDIYTWNGNSWSQDFIDKPTDGSVTYKGFGGRVTISEDGNTIAVAAPFSDVGSTNGAGVVLVYRWNDDTSSWDRTDNDAIQGTNANDHFGSSIHLDKSGSILCVGAPNATIGSKTSCGYFSTYLLINNQWVKVNQTDGSESDERLGTNVKIFYQQNLFPPFGTYSGSLQNRMYVSVLGRAKHIIYTADSTSKISYPLISTDNIDWVSDIIVDDGSDATENWQYKYNNGASAMDVFESTENISVSNNLKTFKTWMIRTDNQLTGNVKIYQYVPGWESTDFVTQTLTNSRGATLYESRPSSTGVEVNITGNFSSHLQRVQLPGESSPVFVVVLKENFTKTKPYKTYITTYILRLKSFLSDYVPSSNSYYSGLQAQPYYLSEYIPSRESLTLISNVAIAAGPDSSLPNFSDRPLLSIEYYSDGNDYSALIPEDTDGRIVSNKIILKNKES